MLKSNAVYDWQVLKPAHDRWTWAVFLSPSAALCLAALVMNLQIPIQLTMLIMTYFDESSPDAFRKRYLFTCFTVIAIFIFPLIVECVVWGSFPLNFDSNGVGRLRLIPFFPWPNNPYGSL